MIVLGLRRLVPTYAEIENAARLHRCARLWPPNGKFDAATPGFFFGKTQMKMILVAVSLDS